MLMSSILWARRSSSVYLHPRTLFSSMNACSWMAKGPRYSDFVSDIILHLHFQCAFFQAFQIELDIVFPGGIRVAVSKYLGDDSYFYVVLQKVCRQGSPERMPSDVRILLRRKCGSGQDRGNYVVQGAVYRKCIICVLCWMSETCFLFQSISCSFSSLMSPMRRPSREASRTIA